MYNEFQNDRADTDDCGCGSDEIEVTQTEPTFEVIERGKWYTNNYWVRWRFRRRLITNRFLITRPMGPDTEWEVGDVGAVYATRHNWARIDDGPDAEFQTLGDETYLKVYANRVTFGSPTSWIEGKAHYSVHWRANDDEESSTGFADFADQDNGMVAACGRKQRFRQTYSIPTADCDDTKGDQRQLLSHARWHARSTIEAICDSSHVCRDLKIYKPKTDFSCRNRTLTLDFEQAYRCNAPERQD